MTYTGRVQNGVIVLDDADAKLPEGEAVRVERLASSVPRSTIADRLRNIIGKAEGLPPDAASKVDEYLYGDNSE